MRRDLARNLAIAALALLAAALAPPSSAQAWTYKVIYSFCAKADCADGGGALGPLLIDSSGNLFGTTDGGGKHFGGTIFRLFNDGQKWRHETLYDPRKTDQLDSHLIEDSAGNLYGTTAQGGKYFYGTAFELIRPSDGGKWTHKTLYNFCVDGGPYCPDGRQPEGGLTYTGAATGVPYDGLSPLFGSTDVGGQIGSTGSGTVFELKRNPDTGKWRQSVIHMFCSPGNCSDGIHPSMGGIVSDVAGNIFGTTKAGGAAGQGTVFQLSTQQHGAWLETTLYNFCSAEACSDGAYGKGALLIDASGNLLGTTLSGGVPCPDPAGCGVLFRLVPNGTQSVYNVLYAFCSLPDCADGRYPAPGLALDSASDVIGMTIEGGGNDTDRFGEGGGVVFTWNGTEPVAHRFCERSGCTDGEYPTGSPVMDAAGNIFGVTDTGGKYGGGTAFELSP